MPVLDVPIVQTASQNHLGILRAKALNQSKLLGRITNGKEIRWASAWTSTQNPKGVNVRLGHLKMWHGDCLIKAVATLEPDCSVESEEGHEASNYAPFDTESNTNSTESSTGLDEKEKLRRKRISKANKGNTPWNKGRKHSPETLQRIREKTRLAMQDPKVRMRLINLGHAQTNETRTKIGIGVRLGWQKRREKLMLQEMCYFEWQNLVAEASRKGCVGEEELQWDSYKTLGAKLEQEWLKSVEERKSIPRKGNKRAPKSLDQRRKISEAISAKWADPEYRLRVCSAQAKYHGTPVGAERKSRRRGNGSVESTKRKPAKKKAIDACDFDLSTAKSQNRKPKLKRSNRPQYEDPLVSSKLKMIQNIRMQRAAAEETKKIEAVERAKLLIAEAEKAARALEAAATRNPLARSSLAKARKLIGEAVQSIESIDKGMVGCHENSGWPSGSPGRASYPALNRAHFNGYLNGAEALHLLGSHNENVISAGGGYGLQNVVNGNGMLDASFGEYADMSGLELGDFVKLSDSKLQRGGDQPHEELNGATVNGFCENHIEKVSQPLEEVNGVNGSRNDTIAGKRTASKKWVRGRLVEVP